MELSAEIGLSFKEVNKWLWDQQQRKIKKQEKGRQLLEECHEKVFKKMKLFKVVGDFDKETRASKKCDNKYLKQ